MWWTWWRSVSKFRSKKRTDWNAFWMLCMCRLVCRWSVCRSFWTMMNWTVKLWSTETQKVSCMVVVWERKRKRESVCVCVSMCEREHVCVWSCVCSLCVQVFCVALSSLSLSPPPSLACSLSRSLSMLLYMRSCIHMRFTRRRLEGLGV